MSAMHRRKIPTPRSTENVFSPRLGGFRTPGRSQLANVSLLAQNMTYSFAGSGSAERYHSLQDYGNPMPVLISEALNITEKLIEYTVKIDPSGWAWLVGGRKLFIWRYNQSSHEKSSRIVKELTLPPSDLAHDANRVCVIPSPRESQQAACVAVSPEGVVRYWSSIAHEAAFVEISAELKGEECACVVNLQPYGCILATTTSSFVLLTPVTGQNSITCHMIRASQGMLAGITRKMSSFIFGSSPAQASGAALHALVASDDGYESGEDRFFYVLSGSVLQKWSVSSSNTEMLLYQSNVQRLFRTHLAKKIWNQDVARLPQLNTWLLDMQLTSDGAVILAAAMNNEVGNTVYYAIGVVNLQELSDAVDLETVIVLEHVETWQDSNEDTILGYHLLVADAEGDEAMVYNKTHVHCISLDGNFPSESVDFSRLRDRILGVGKFISNPLLFSAHRGILLVSHVSNQQKLGVGDTEGMLDMEETVGASDSTQGIFTSAFVAFCHKKTKRAEELLMKILPTEMNPDFGMDTETAKTLPAQSTELDQIVAQTSLSIVDDYPSADPRWAESKNATPDLGYKSSNLILKQLEKKLNLLEMFNKFLRYFNLTDKLNSIPVRDVLMDTTMFICENAEKVAAMIALRSSEQDYKFLEEMSLLPTIIKRIVDKRGETSHSVSLTHLDLFYREVSGVQDIFTECLEYENDNLTADMNPKHIVNLVVTMNDLILYILRQALQYRLNKRSYYARFSETFIQTEYIPWTCSIGRMGMRALLKKQCSMTLEQGIINAQDHSYQATLFNQLTDLADILLNGYSSQLTSLEVYDNKSSRYNQLCKMYEEDRATLISMLMENKEFEKAASLAEKYYDFATLAKVCDITEDEDRLQRYCNIFAHKGFRESMYHYYLRTGKRGKLLTMPLTVELSLVLNKCKSLSWLMDIESQDYFSAYETLFSLAIEERKFVSRKKTVLSMAKLCLLSTGRDIEDLLPAINIEQELITHQELIPPEVLHSLGMDPDNMRVLLPHEMIELYIHDENIHATEYHFKMALDLLPFVAKKEPEIDVQSLFLHIWCKAVLRNNWSRRFDDPVEDYSSKLFYKIIILANSQYADMNEILPNKNVLLAAEELSHLQSDDNFAFLIETIYEQLSNTM